MSNQNYIINNYPLVESGKEIEEEMTEIELNSNEQEEDLVDQEDDWNMQKRMQNFKKKSYLRYGIDDDPFTSSESQDMDDDFEVDHRYSQPNYMFPRFPHHKKFQSHKMGERDRYIKNMMGSFKLEEMFKYLQMRGIHNEEIKMLMFKNKMMQKRKMHFFDGYGNEEISESNLKKMRKIDMEERIKEVEKEIRGCFGEKGDINVEYSQEQKEKIDREIKLLLVQRGQVIDLLKDSVSSGASVEVIENLDKCARENLDEMFNLVKLIEDYEFKKSKMALFLELKCELNCISKIEQNKIN
eukprot:TRINITY_DN4366_c0_g1_i1.p1 TRINITY_DN4366_c0_g1~~TRINITY_DN4366_c0_g1_i1.p1  ORF type:complete len:298 (-),score=103.49 TRINITY_DN4366_c0_g1_i1:79-972(-)